MLQKSLFIIFINILFILITNTLHSQSPFWERLNNESLFVDLITEDDSGRVYAADPFDNRKIWMSTDSGESWNNIFNVPPAGQSSYITAVIRNPDNNMLYVSTWEEGFLLSSDNGNTWVQRTNGLGNKYKTLGLLLYPDNSLLAGTYKGVYKSTNNGELWIKQNVTPDSLGVKLLCKNREGQLFVGLWQGGMRKSTDNGVTWTEINTGLYVNIPPNAITINDSDQIFIGTDGMGVYRSADAGATWNFCGIENKAITSIHCGKNGLVIAGTERDETYLSGDNGVTWERIAEGISLTHIVSAVYISKSGYIFAGTWGGGLYRSINKVTGYEENEISAIKDYTLLQNYPNPFNPETVIRYQLSVNSFVTLKVHDVLGKEVATLVNREQSAGRHEVSFDAGHLSSGVYICRLIAGEFVKTIKMSLVK